MTHKKKGQLTTSPEWVKHLRSYMKNQFWRGERNAAKNLIRSELKDLEDETELGGEPYIIWVDFNARSDYGLRLNCKGTIDDLSEQKITMKDGMKLILWDEDFDNSGNRDNLIVEATAKYNHEKRIWEGEFEWSKIKHESEIEK